MRPRVRNYSGSSFYALDKSLTAVCCHRVVTRFTAFSVTILMAVIFIAIHHRCLLLLLLGIPSSHRGCCLAIHVVQTYDDKYVRYVHSVS